MNKQLADRTSHCIAWTGINHLVSRVQLVENSLIMHHAGHQCLIDHTTYSNCSQAKKPWDPLTQYELLAGPACKLFAAVFAGSTSTCCKAVCTKY